MERVETKRYLRIIGPVSNQVVSIKCPSYFQRGTNFSIAREKRGCEKPWLKNFSWNFFDSFARRNVGSSPGNINIIPIILGNPARDRVENLQLNFRRWKGYSRSSSIEKGQLKGRGAGEGETDARTRELKKNIRACTNCWLTRQAWLLPFANGDASPRRLDPFVINVDS